jgi:hypothetical protein
MPDLYDAYSNYIDSDLKINETQETQVPRGFKKGGE